MSRKRGLTDEDTEILKAVRQMQAGKKGRVYRPEPLLAISARQSVNSTKKELPRLLDMSVNSVQNREQRRRSPTGATRTLMRVVHGHPEILEKLAS
jgi:DNA-binding transcriptional regulator YiaG